MRNTKWKFYLEGRSPMEQLKAPSYIPKAEKIHYNNAVIAIHGGQPLAALFQLRTFIEQFARRITGIWTRVAGDEIMITYGELLPRDKRGLMPSLREWYGKLSEAIHEAKPNENLFNEALAEIEKHFKVRDVLEISEVAVRPNSE